MDVPDLLVGYHFSGKNAGGRPHHLHGTTIFVYHNYRLYLPDKLESAVTIGMKQLINTPEAVVLDAVEAYVRCHAHLTRLDGFPEVSL